jgi:predicted dehydrogenase
VGGGSGPSAVAAQRDFGFKRVAASEQALVGDPDVDAVVIATRHGSHARLAREALEQGKHVFVEKPLALTLEDVHSVIDAASTSSGVLAVGFNRRFSPLFVRLRDHLRAAGAPVTGSFRVSAGDIPSKHWVHDLTEGGGRALGEVCHFVDTLAALAGSRVEEVHAVGHGAADLPAQAHDNLVISLRFAGGSVGTIVYVSDGSPGVGKERLEAFSGARTAILDDFVTLQLFNAGQTTEERLKAQDKGHRAEFAAFVDGMRRGSDPVPLAEVENVSVATIAVVESLRSGRPVGVEG